jgi:hypothetical protein
MSEHPDREYVHTEVAEERVTNRKDPPKEFQKKTHLVMRESQDLA